MVCVKLFKVNFDVMMQFSNRKLVWTGNKTAGFIRVTPPPPVGAKNANAHDGDVAEFKLLLRGDRQKFRHTDIKKKTSLQQSALTAADH